MTDPGERQQRVLALVDEALHVGALRFAAPLLRAAIPKQVRTDWGATYALEREIGRGGTATVYLVVRRAACSMHASTFCRSAPPPPPPTIPRPPRPGVTVPVEPA